MSAHPTAFPHGPISEIFPDVFFVTGGFRFAPAVIGTRNMTVVREGARLTVLNSVRLTPEGEKELDALGKVTDVVRVGFFHGADDAYYVERYGAQLWLPPRVDAPAKVPAKVLGKDGCPIEGARVFEFEKGNKGEVALLLEREGGVLVVCDAYQNWTSFEGCSLLCKLMMSMMRFGPNVIGGPWISAMGREVRGDFDRLAELAFRHVIPAHGSVLRDDAKAGIAEAVRKRFA